MRSDMIEEEEVDTDVDKSPPDPPVSFATKMKRFFAGHWRGLLIVITPIISLFVVLPEPTPPYLWVAYTLVIMAVFWMTECLPLAVSAFLPVVIFPISGVMTSDETCKAYMNDTIIMFLGSLMLAYSVEQSGLHKRLAFATIRLIGFSHVRLIGGICIVTTFVSMWVTNTAATTMMVPINFAILKVFSDNNFMTMYEYNADGEKSATEIMSCYFCITTFSATIGGIGTLVGTATNLVFKGLFMTDYPKAQEYLSFPLFSAFAIPYMIVMEVVMFLNLAIVYFGLFRPKSAAAKRAYIDKRGIDAATEIITRDAKKMGNLSFWEFMVIILFGGAMVAFFCRSPQIFPGWSDKVIEAFGITNKKFIQDSCLASLVSFLMLLLPSTAIIVKNFQAKTYEELPKGTITSVLDWSVLNREMPYSFMFLLGGGFALSTASSRSGLNTKIGEALQFLSAWPNEAVLFVLIVIVTLVTNFASNVAVANVFVPIAMSLAKQIQRNPLWYNIATGFSASYCFMLPVGTPGNLIAQSAASIPTTSMMKLGFGPTITTIIITWFAMTYWAPIVWPDLKTRPEWIKND